VDARVPVGGCARPETDLWLRRQLFLWQTTTLGAAATTKPMQYGLTPSWKSGAKIKSP